MSVENLVFVHYLTTDYEMDGAPKARHSLPLLAMISCAIHWCSVVCSVVRLSHRYITAKLGAGAIFRETTKRGGQKQSQREILCKQLCVETKRVGWAFFWNVRLRPQSSEGMEGQEWELRRRWMGKERAGWGWALDEGAEDEMRPGVRHMRGRQELKAVVWGPDFVEGQWESTEGFECGELWSDY